MTGKFYNVPADVKEASLEAVVIRADGRREELGQIAHYRRSAVRSFFHSIAEWLRSF